MTTPTMNKNSLWSSNIYEGQWIGDGGGDLALQNVERSSSSLTLTSANRGTPLNVRYETDASNGPLINGDWFFQVTLVRIESGSSVSVGVVNPEEMGVGGWKVRGMFYNGNLTNGSASLLTSFGPYLKEGDTVGVHVANNNTQVTFFYNGRCLGVGFRLRDVPKDKVYCPCLHVDGTVQISFTVPEYLPVSSLEAEKEVAEGCVGEWKLVEATNEERSAVNIPLVVGLNDLILNVRPDKSENTYDLSIRVANVLRTQMKVVGDDGGTHQVEIGLLMSTMMMPPPPLRELETFVSSSLPKVHSMQVDDGTLLLRGGDSASKLLLKFAQYRKTVEPLETYQH